MKGRKRNRKTPPRVNREWVLGSATSPVQTEAEGPDGSRLILILEETLVVGFKLLKKDESLELRALLERTMNQPAVGAPRIPASFRVAGPELKAEVLVAFPDTPVSIGPTPEVDQALLEFQKQYAGDEEITYLQDGEIPEQLMHGFFQAALDLFQAAPWKKMYETDTLRVDIESAGVEGACVSILGNAEIDYGFSFYPTHKDYERLIELVQSSEGVLPDVPTPKNIKTMSLSLNYDKAVDLSPTMRKEAAKHNWPVTGPDAYPVPTHLLNDLSVTEHEEEDVALLALVAEGLTEFFTRYGAEFGADEFEARSETMDVNGVGIRLTFPYEAFGDFAGS